MDYEQAFFTLVALDLAFVSSYALKRMKKPRAQVSIPPQEGNPSGPEPVRRHEKPKEPQTINELETIYYSANRLEEYAAWKFKGNKQKALASLKEKLEKKSGMLYELPESA